VVESALGALLDQSHPSHWLFGAVKGALCRLEWMGAPSVLRAIVPVRSELHSLVEGFDWQTLESTLLHALRGGKGRDLKEMGRFQRGHVCTILNEGVFTI
jgi:hypothetical protein